MVMMGAFAIDTPDLDQARELVGKLIVPFGLRPCRSSGYHARVKAGRAGRIGVAEVSYQAAVEIDSHSPDDTLILEIPVSGYCRALRSNAERPLRRGDVTTTLPGRRIRTWMGDANRLLIMRIPSAILDPSGEWDLASFEPWRWTPAPALRPDRLASLERLAALVFEETATAGAVASDETLGGEIQHVLLALLGAPNRTFRLDRTGADDDSWPLPRSVRRAQALMIAAPMGGMTLPALARQCGVSVRTLQDNFRQFTGTTPSEWWRAYRLERVRTALSTGRPGTGVTEAATAYGFFHLGRFAEQYRARFGETPSETRRRTRETSDL